MMEWLQRAYELDREGQPYALVTVIEAKGSSPRDIGAKMLVTDEETAGTIGGGRFESLAIEDARKALAEAQAGTEKYPLCFRTGQCCGGAVETFIEVYGCGPQLYLFGGGHVGQALCRVLDGTPFQVTLVEDRPEWADHPDLPRRVHVRSDGWQAFLETAKFHQQMTYAVVMTHDHALDQDIIEKLIALPARFVGLIGSETKWKRFQQRLSHAGVETDLLGRVHCPIGRKTPGKAPKEIAVNIAAALFADHYDR